MTVWWIRLKYLTSTKCKPLLYYSYKEIHEKLVRYELYDEVTVVSSFFHKMYKLTAGIQMFFYRQPTLHTLLLLFTSPRLD